MRKNRIILKTLIILTVAFLGALYFNRVKIKDYFEELKKEPIPEPISIEEIQNKKEDLEEQEIEQEIILPSEINIDVPFISQAPESNWDEPWQNACEEAAILMVHYFWLGKKSITKENAKKEILELIDYQIKTSGVHKDLTVEEIAALVKDYYHYKDVSIQYDITINDIKKQLALGFPVIVPAYGRILDNPNYTAPGPVYHMLVAVGYTPKVIITNDPGTRKGDEFQFTYDNFYNAIHDFVKGASEHPEKMEQGRKAMIVIKK